MSKLAQLLKGKPTTVPAGQDREVDLDSISSSRSGLIKNSNESKNRLTGRRSTLSSIYDFPAEGKIGSTNAFDKMRFNDCNWISKEKPEDKKHVPKPLLKKKAKSKKDLKMYDSMPTLNDELKKDNLKQPLLKNEKGKHSSKKLKKTLTKEDISTPSNFKILTSDVLQSAKNSKTSKSRPISNVESCTNDMDESSEVPDDVDDLKTFLQKYKLSSTLDMPRRVSLPPVPTTPSPSLRHSASAASDLLKMYQRTVRVNLPDGNVLEVSYSSSSSGNV